MTPSNDITAQMRERLIRSPDLKAGETGSPNIQVRICMQPLFLSTVKEIKNSHIPGICF